jgi:hypothetical protein
MRLYETFLWFSFVIISFTLLLSQANNAFSACSERIVLFDICQHSLFSLRFLPGRVLLRVRVRVDCIVFVLRDWRIRRSRRAPWGWPPCSVDVARHVSLLSCLLHIWGLLPARLHSSTLFTCTVGLFIRSNGCTGTGWIWVFYFLFVFCLGVTWNGLGFRSTQNRETDGGLSDRCRRMVDVHMDGWRDWVMEWIW